MAKTPTHHEADARSADGARNDHLALEGPAIPDLGYEGIVPPDGSETPAGIADVATVDVMSASDRDLLLRLTAANAALDPGRHRWRRDIHLSAVLEVLGSVESPMTTDQVVQETRRAWGTESVPKVSISEAIALAHQGGFISQVRSFDDIEAWQLSSATREEVKRDQRWAAEVLEQFRAQLGENLSGLTEVKRSRIPRLSELLLMACIAATNGVYEVARYPDRLGPLELDLRAMTQYLKSQVQPKSVFEAMVRMAEAIADPDDEFGNQILHLLVTGNILHGLMSHQDLAETPGIQGHRIVIDTSALVYWLDPDSNERRIFDLMINETLEAGGEVIVPLHVLDEWDSVWSEADVKIRSLDRESIALIAEGHILVSNPVAQAFASCARRNPSLNWFRYATQRKSIRQELKARGVSIRQHGNGDREADLIERVSERLQKPGARPFPTATKAQRDANSCGMVARWREEDGLEPPRAWFVAQDKATGKAYAKERPGDRYPLTVTPESWIMFMSVMAPPKEEALADRINAIGDAVRRASFLNVASGYPIDDALKMMQILQESESGVVTQDELRQSVQIDLTRLLAQADFQAADPIPLAVEVAQRRIRRGNHQAERDKIDALQEEARLRREREAFEGDKSALLDQVDAANRRADQVEIRSRRRTHRNIALAVYVAIVVNLGLAFEWATLTEPFWIPAGILVCGFALLWLVANHYVAHIDLPLKAYLFKIAAGALVETILLLAALYTAYALGLG